MRAGIIQSNYIPWRGTFDFIASVDVFVIYDDVQYSKNSWRNRNQVKTPIGLKWLTVPVHSKLHLTIDQVEIACSQKDWREDHRRRLIEALGPAPFFDHALGLWEAGVAFHDILLSPLNIRLIRTVCDYLQINTPILNSRDYILNGVKTERLIQLLKQLGANTYLSGPTAQGYLDEDLFRENGLRLEYKTYDYPAYPQLWGEFVGNVTVLDLIANTGPAARDYLKSVTPHQVVIQ